MSLSLDRLTKAYSFARKRISGAFFLALGVLLLYWSGRGFFAYAAGIRAPQSDPLACGAGLLAGGLSLWVANYLLRYGIPGTQSRLSPELDAIFDKASALLDSDPAAATRLLDEYFEREAAATAARRGQLRQRAPRDSEAAVALRRELQEEVREKALLKKDLLTRLPEAERADKLVEIEASVGDLNAEILRLDDSIGRLKRG